MPFVDTKATWQPNHPILTSCVKAILKAMTDTGFLGPGLRIFRFFFIYGQKFLQQERVLLGCLADPSLNKTMLTLNNEEQIIFSLLRVKIVIN